MLQPLQPDSTMAATAAGGGRATRSANSRGRARTRGLRVAALTEGYSPAARGSLGTSRCRRGHQASALQTGEIVRDVVVISLDHQGFGWGVHAIVPDHLSDQVYEGTLAVLLIALEIEKRLLSGAAGQRIADNKLEVPIEGQVAVEH